MIVGWLFGTDIRGGVKGTALAHKISQRRWARLARLALRPLPVAALLLGLAAPALAQVGPDPWEDLRIEAVRIQLVNPPADPAERAAIEDSARKALGLFPGSGFRNLLLDWGLGRVSALATVASAKATLRPAIPAAWLSIRSVTSAGARRNGRASGPGFPFFSRRANALLKLKAVAARLPMPTRMPGMPSPTPFWAPTRWPTTRPAPAGPAGAKVPMKWGFRASGR